MKFVNKRVADLAASDTTAWYQVISITTKNGKVIAQVRFKDGGMSERVWDNANTMVKVYK